MKGMPTKATLRTSKRRRKAASLHAAISQDKSSGLSMPIAELKPLFEEIVDAAMSISGADFGDIQLVDYASSALRIVAYSAFPKWWIKFWNSLPRGRGSCGVSFERGERVTVEDVEKSPIFTGAGPRTLLQMQRKVGIRACQSTPIFSRWGKPLGVLSTHFKRPYRPDKRTLPLLDVLARQAAEIIQHAQAKAALRAAEERLQRVLETKTVAVLFWDQTGTLIEANDAFLRMTGYSRAQVQGRELTWRRLTPPEWVAISEEQLKKLAATGHIGPYEKEYFLKNGSRRWMMFVGRDLGDGTIVEYCIDITDRKQMETEREREGLRKDEFLSLLGHELRNPLTAISFATDLLRSDLTAERRASLEEIVSRQVGLLRRLVDDLLDLARITHGQISLKKAPIDLAEFLQRVAGSARSFFAERDQELILRLPSGCVSFVADETRVEQIIINLLSNASKYTSRRGRIQLSGSEEGSNVVFRCKDNGRGIPIDLQEQIFEPFTRGPLARDSHGEASLGIGLTLVKKLTELHGGDVSVESGGLSTGSEFSIRLPLVKAPTASRRQSKALLTPRNGPALSILLVEDNLDVAQTLTIALEEAGHKVTHFADGFSALAGLPGLQPDAALIDIGLPDMDGYDLAVKLRTKRSLHDTLFVAISGFKKRIETAKTRGNFDHYLVKPINFANLLAFLDKYARARRTASARSARTENPHAG